MTSDQSDNGVLVNYPLKFAGATSGVIVSPAPPVGVPLEGLPQSSFKEVVKRDGSREGAVQAVVDPPQGGNYLNIALYMRGLKDSQPQLLERRSVPPAQQNDAVYFDVYQSVFGDNVHVFTYEVERTSGNSGPSTESWALYHRDVPGGNDVPGTGDHPDLFINLPVELGEPPQIGKEDVDKGVVCTLFYSYLRAYDRITLELNRERFSYVVQPGQEFKPYEITITRAMFEQAGSNPRFPISYTVVDQVNNPTDKRRWSKVIEANVDTDRATLEQAVLREIPTENNDVPTEVDLAKMNGGPLWALIHLPDKIWSSGDEIHLLFTAMLEGNEVAIHEATLPIKEVPGQFSWDIPNAKVIADSRVRVVYEQIRGTKVIGVSKVAEAQVLGGTTGPVGDIVLGLGQKQGAISPDGLRVYVGHIGSISVIDTTTNRRVDTIYTANTNFFAGLVVTPDGAKLYAAAGEPNEVLVIDTGSNKVIKHIAAGGTPNTLVMKSDGSQVILHNHSSTNGVVKVIDAGSDEVIRTFSTGSYTSGGGISPDGQNFYYIEHRSGSGSGSVLVAIDTSTGRRLGFNTMPNARHTLAVSPDGQRIYLPSMNDSSFSLLEVEASSLRLLRTINHSYPVDQYTVAFSPDGSRLYLCGWSLRTILKVDLASESVIGLPQSGATPYGVVCTLDGKRLYVCNSGSSYLTVVATD